MATHPRPSTPRHAQTLTPPTTLRMQAAAGSDRQLDLQDRQRPEDIAFDAFADVYVEFDG